MTGIEYRLKVNLSVSFERVTKWTRAACQEKTANRKVLYEDIIEFLIKMSDKQRGLSRTKA